MGPGSDADRVGRGDVYNADDTLATTIAIYRGNPGWQSRAIGAVAVDVQWPLGRADRAGTQRMTPRVQMVATPPIGNLSVPNEDARAIELEDSNLFALNRFPGYDRWEDRRGSLMASIMRWTCPASR